VVFAKIDKFKSGYRAYVTNWHLFLNFGRNYLGNEGVDYLQGFKKYFFHLPNPEKHYKRHVHYFFIVLFIFSYHFHFRSFYFLSLTDIWMATSYLISLGIPELSNSNNKRLVNQKRLCPNRNVKVICKETKVLLHY